jgi:hypothetical protein
MSAQIDDSDVINFLLSTEIIPLCLRIMDSGSELSKTVLPHAMLCHSMPCHADLPLAAVTGRDACAHARGMWSCVFCARDSWVGHGTDRAVP